jgi:SPP1 gp7 family putative phage head morphogenesis protein
MPIKYKTSKPTEQYWKDRYSLKESLGDRTEKEMLIYLKELYLNTMLEINKEIEAFYGRYAKNNNLTLAEVKKRLNPKELESAKKEIAKYYSDIDRLARNSRDKVSIKLLRKYKLQLRWQSAKAYMSRLEDLKARIKHNLVKLGLEENKCLHSSLMKTAENSYTKSAYTLSKYTGFANTFSDTQFEKIVNERWLGKNYSDRVWKNKELLEKELEKTFLQGVVRGQNPRTVARGMYPTLKDAVQDDFKNAYYACERLARTEMIHTLNESTMQSYKDYGVEKYQFVCGLNERTCPECENLDGKVFAISEKMEGVNYPVIHPFCGCTTIPYFERDEIDEMFEEDE